MSRRLKTESLRSSDQHPLMMTVPDDDVSSLSTRSSSGRSNNGNTAASTAGGVSFEKPQPCAITPSPPPAPKTRFYKRLLQKPSLRSGSKPWQKDAAPTAPRSSSRGRRRRRQRGGGQSSSDDYSSSASSSGAPSSAEPSPNPSPMPPRSSSFMGGNMLPSMVTPPTKIVSAPVSAAAPVMVSPEEEEYPPEGPATSIAAITPSPQMDYAKEEDQPTTLVPSSSLFSPAPTSLHPQCSDVFETPQQFSIAEEHKEDMLLRSQNTERSNKEDSFYSLPNPSPMQTAVPTPLQAVSVAETERSEAQDFVNRMLSGIVEVTEEGTDSSHHQPPQLMPVDHHPLQLTPRKAEAEVHASPPPKLSVDDLEKLDINNNAEDASAWLGSVMEEALETEVEISAPAVDLDIVELDVEEEEDPTVVHVGSVDDTHPLSSETETPGVEVGQQVVVAGVVLDESFLSEGTEEDSAIVVVVDADDNSDEGSRRQAIMHVGSVDDDGSDEGNQQQAIMHVGSVDDDDVMNKDEEQKSEVESVCGSLTKASEGSVDNDEIDCAGAMEPQLQQPSEPQTENENQSGCEDTPPVEADGSTGSDPTRNDGGALSIASPGAADSEQSEDALATQLDGEKQELNAASTASCSTAPSSFVGESTASGEQYVVNAATQLLPNGDKNKLSVKHLRNLYEKKTTPLGEILEIGGTASVALFVENLPSPTTAATVMSSDDGFSSSLEDHPLSSSLKPLSLRRRFAQTDDSVSELSGPSATAPLPMEQPCSLEGFYRQQKLMKFAERQKLKETWIRYHCDKEEEVVVSLLTQPSAHAQVYAPSASSTEDAVAPADADEANVLVDYKARDYRGFLFVVHNDHGLLLLHCTRKATKPPHYQLPGGHVDEEEFMEAARHSQDRQSQLLLACKAGAARELYEETGMDVRANLDRLEPAQLHPLDQQDGANAINEHLDRLFFFLQVSDDDFVQSEADENAAAVSPQQRDATSPSHLRLQLSHEHSGFAFEPEPSRAAELLHHHSGGKCSDALLMAMSEDKQNALAGVRAPVAFDIGESSPSWDGDIDLLPRRPKKRVGLLCCFFGVPQQD